MKPLQIIQEKKLDLYKNLLLVALLSAGISLCANYFSNQYVEKKFLLWSGIACVLIVIIAYVVSFYNSKSFVIKTKSLFVTGKDGLLIPIERYGISEEMNRDLCSVFSENKVFKSMWVDAFAKSVKTEERKNKIEGDLFRNKKVIDFVGELIEYAFIEWLSLKQSSYFNSFDDDDLEVLTREKISDYLLQNRVLEMISKPYDEREQFVKDNRDSDPKEGRICSIYSGGIIYHQFDLQMPKKSRLYKDGKKLVIKNRNYTIKFTHNFMGFNANTAFMFERFYLNRSIRDVSAYEFNPTLEIRLNPIFFLFWKDWKYMKWMDIICEQFTEYFSFEKFIDRIGYETAVTYKIITSNTNTQHTPNYTNPTSSAAH